MRLFYLILIYALLPAAADAQEKENAMETVTVTTDAGETAEYVKPLNDMCCGLACLRGYFDFASHYKELGVRYVRLHDIPFTFDAVKDINCVCPDMDADPVLEESYWPTSAK